MDHVSLRSIEELYEELKLFYAKIKPAMGDGAYGGRILYTPPKVNAKLMFVGIQPGGDTRTLDRRWPETNEYADDNGARKLGAKLRKMVSSSALRNVVGTNANFFRARSDKEYRKNLPIAVRRKITEFCLPRVSRLIEVLQPRTIFCIGFKAFDDLNPDDEKIDEMQKKGKQPLFKLGTVSDRPVVAVPHLTGYRLASPDIDRIERRLRSLL